MKLKYLVIGLVAALALTLAGCGCSATNTKATSASAPASVSDKAAPKATTSSAAKTTSAATTSSAAKTTSTASKASTTSTASESKPASQSTPSESESDPIPPASEWTSVSSVVEAAKGAGFDSFDVLEDFEAHGITYSAPKFSYLDGVAQATYESPATMVQIRKAVGVYGAPITDRNVNDFPVHWTENHKGLNIECYGPEQGKATVFIWKYGDVTCGCTYQGLGGEEMTMDVDEITSLVSGIQ